LLPVKCIHPFTQAGMFGAVRKYDVHTGLDIYCKPDSPVRAARDGTIIEVIPFTGASVGSPWWNETSAVAIDSGQVFVYGEVKPLVKVGDTVQRGQIIGTALEVLKEDKGVNPTCMLHLEVWDTNYQSNFTWEHGTKAPDGLINPLSIFNFWIVKTNSGYRIETHDGRYWKRFDMAADCKAYCMSRTEETGERFEYVNSRTGNAKLYYAATGKFITKETW
jgi:murein DD-endopeptidase MepM/ murein hydrolase activator NlpD